MLLEQITSAGIVGCGGAGFPTAAKYNTKAEYFIINAAECEPLLKTDHYVMNHYADECIQSIAAVGKLLEAEHIVIATKEHYTKEINALETAIQAQNAPISIFKMKNFYPAGDEQIMVFEVTGRTVPPGGIPIEVGCVISNISTMLNIYQAQHGKNVTHKLLTITGAVKEPKILEVPIGTSFDDCLALAGGATIDDFMFINGGPMMGKTGTQEDFSQQVVTKTTSGIIIME
ncbi:MAG: SLBB domain-containing protein, partial [Enterococcus hulanensis]